MLFSLKKTFKKHMHSAHGAAAEMKHSCDSDRDADLFRSAGYFIRHKGRGREHVINGHDSDGSVCRSYLSKTPTEDTESMDDTCMTDMQHALMPQSH